MLLFIVTRAPTNHVNSLTVNERDYSKFFTTCRFVIDLFQVDSNKSTWSLYSMLC